MKILYDISVLGLGHARPEYRTGIYRVVDSLTPLIAGSAECNLTFCAASNAGPAMRYAQSRSELQHIPFAGGGIRQTVNQIHYQLDQSIRVNPDAGQLPRRALKRLFRLVDARLQSDTVTVSSSRLVGTDIYHSLYYALPPSTRHTQSVQRFLTVYDLTPIHFPQFFTPPHIDTFKGILASLRPEDWVLAISEATKIDLCANHPIDPSRVFVTPLAADPALFYPAGKEEQHRVRCKYNLVDKRYILSLNTLEPRKNLERLIRCFVRLLQQQPIPNLYLVLTGSRGWNSEQIFAEISGLEAVRDRILLAGRVEDEDLAGLYSGAELFAYPSLYEGFGLPPLEAMQCGTPVITSNTSSLPEVVGDAGLMATPTDEDALCQSLLCLLEDAALRAEKAKKALERARQFSWERCANLTIQAYKNALK